MSIPEVAMLSLNKTGYLFFFKSIIDSSLNFDVSALFYYTYRIIRSFIFLYICT